MYDRHEHDNWTPPPVWVRLIVGAFVAVLVLAVCGLVVFVRVP